MPSSWARAGEMSDVESVMMAKDIIAPFVGARQRRLLKAKCDKYSGVALHC